MTTNQQVDMALSNALASARERPDDTNAWNDLESIAAEQQAPEPVAELYAELLATDLPSPVARRLGERATRFCEEWFADDAPQLQSVMLRVFERDPTDESVFDRLAMGLTAVGRWNSLMDIYDRAVDATDSLERKISLLDDAVRVAKDLAHDSDRAISFLERLVPLRAGDHGLRAQLERLLERAERWQDLIALWDSGSDALPPAEELRVRVQIATCWLDKLKNAPAAVDALRRALESDPRHQEAIALAERILASEDGAPGTRRSALGLLRKAFELAGKPLDVARVIRVAEGFALGEELERLHRDAAAIFEQQGQGEEALEEFGRLLALRPEDEVVEEQARTLANKLPAHARFVDILAHAATRATRSTRAGELRLKAATIAHDPVGDTERAIALCEQVFATDKDPQLALDAGRALDALLEANNRSQARVPVLERLSLLETDKERKREVLGALAKLAGGQGDSERAVATWQKRLQADPSDREAVDGLVALYQAREDHRALVEVLRRRVELVGDPACGNDLAQIAQIQTDLLGDLEAALSTWSELCERAPNELPATDLGALIDKSASREATRGARVLSSLGDAYRTLVGNAESAVHYYARALATDSAHASARAGLKALLSHESVASVAADALTNAFVATDDFAELLELLPYRLAGTVAPSERARLLRHAAQLEEHRLTRPEKAFQHLGAALVEEPQNASFDAELWRFAESQGAWSALGEILSDAAVKLDPASPRAVQLKSMEGELWERRAKDVARAFAAYSAAARGRSLDPALADAICRTGVALGKHQEVWEVALKFSRDADRLPEDLLQTIERGIADREQWHAFCDVAEAGVEQAKLAAPLKRSVLTRLSEWREKRAGDADGAESLLIKASRSGSPHVETLRKLAVLQRRNPDRALFDTLVAISQLSADDVDSLVEAARLVFDVLAEKALARPVLERTFAGASSLLLRGQRPAGSMSAETALLFATEELCRLAEQAGDHAAKIAVLREAAQLPIDPAQAHALAERAAKCAVDDLNADELGVQLYQRVLELRSDDESAMSALAVLYDRLGRLDELLVLRRRELAIAQNVPRRLELRLDVARVMAEIEARGGLIGALSDNLKDSPGHAASLDALERIYRERGALKSAYDLFAAQGAQLEGLGDAARSAQLWLRAGRIADGELHREDDALISFQKVAALKATDEALDALARIRLGRHEPQLALTWLERRLDTTPRDSRAPLRLKMAVAYKDAGKLESAIDCLVLAVEENADAFELRGLLAQHYRDAGRDEDLAALLAESAPRAPDSQLLLTYAREAAALFQKLGKSERAVEVLKRAVEVDSEDRALKCLLADGLTASGQLEDARVLLDNMVQAFGRRRSPERAEVHMRLAKVAQAAGNTEEALSQLDTAAGMDRAHVGILRSLGELAHEAGQLDRAERAYRSLLLVVRKPQPGSDVSEIGVGEVLYQLHRLAAQLGQAEKATELLDSAVQTAAQSEAETVRLKQLLLQRGEPVLLLRVLEQRLSLVTDPVTEARVLADLADVLEQALEKPEEALEARLKALAQVPADEAFHESALRVAQSISKVGRYIESLKLLIERARRKEEQSLVSDLALRAGSTLEHVLEDLEGAESQYKLVDQTSAGYIEAQFALARVAGRLGHEDQEHAVLERIVALPDDPAYADGRRGARYRLIALQVERADEREKGLAALETLVKEDPDYVRAGAILQAACDAAPNDMRAITMLEQVARRSDEPSVLLDFLERHARAEDASLGLVREGAELAIKIEDHARAEKFLRRAIDIAEKGDGLVEALWAAIALGRVRRDRGDLKGAMEWLEKALNVCDPIEGYELGLELAALAAGKGKDPARAARIYEGLRERDPSDRRAWAPLLDLYRVHGDVTRVNDLVRSTLEALIDPDERNELRLDTARRLFAAGYEDEGASLLHDVLAEDPDHEEATLKLADLYERRGENEALADLLTRKLESARERRSNSLIPISLRMGGLLKPTQPGQAMDIYREALVIIPESSELMRAAIDVIDPVEGAAERALLLERYLSGDGKNDSDVVELVLWLLDYHTNHGDEGSFEQALAMAYRAAPGHDGIRMRLEQWYRNRNDFPNLAQWLEQEAERQEDLQRRVALLAEAAEIRLEKMNQPSEAAALLRRARESAPDDFDLLKRAVYTSAQSGELGPALAEIDAALENEELSKRQRVELLLLRAEVAGTAGMHDDAVAALDQAYADGGAAVLSYLTVGIERARLAAKERNNLKRERELTLRMVGLLHQTGDLAKPIDLLVSWVQRVQNDIDALRALLELLTAAKRWADVVRVAEALIASDRVEILPQITERLLVAAKALGQPAAARAGLERALNRDASQAKLVTLLIDLYNEIGEKRGLAELLMKTLPANAPADKRFETLRQIGQLLLDAGDVDAALKPLTQASELKPDDVPTVLFIADAHIAAKRFQQAQDLLERSMNAYKQRRSPELASLRHRMAKLSQAAGDAQARLEWLNAAIEADMNNGDVASELAVVAQNMGQLDIALKALRAITMLKGDCPMSRAEAFYRQAVIVAQKGEPRRAVLWAKKAKQEDASFPGIDKLLAELGEG